MPRPSDCRSQENGAPRCRSPCCAGLRRSSKQQQIKNILHHERVLAVIVELDEFPDLNVPFDRFSFFDFLIDLSFAYFFFFFSGSYARIPAADLTMHPANFQSIQK